MGHWQANGHCCQVPKGVVCKFSKKFGQMGKNAAFFETYLFTAKNDKINIT
jgi:hypothetical protein